MRSHSNESKMLTFFQNSLRECGLDGVSVTSDFDPETNLEKFYVSKKITADEKLVYKTTFNTAFYSMSELQQRIAMEAEQIAQEFNDELMDTFEWFGRVVKVSLYDGGIAKCPKCKSQATAPQAQYIIQESAELSDPTPMYRDMSHALDQMDDHQENIFKLYLIGLLQYTCDKSCPNSKYNLY